MDGEGQNEGGFVSGQESLLLSLVLMGIFSSVSLLDLVGFGSD